MQGITLRYNGVSTCRAFLLLHVVITRKSLSFSRVQSAREREQPVAKKMDSWKCHRNLLSSECVLLLSVVPTFYHHILKRQHQICDLMKEATGDLQIITALEKLYKEIWMEKV